MLIRKLTDCDVITSGDNTCLRELLHPHREYAFDGRYSLAHAVVAPGCQTIRHRMKTDEVYYILEGAGKMHIDDEVAAVEAGDAIEIPPGAAQWIENTGVCELVFLCIVDPAWREVDEEIL